MSTTLIDTVLKKIFVLFITFIASVIGETDDRGPLTATDTIGLAEFAYMTFA
jgi:hypothetical protein